MTCSKPSTPLLLLFINNVGESGARPGEGGGCSGGEKDYNKVNIRWLE